MVGKDEAGGGMRAPGVVARLMGLDAVPAPAVNRQAAEPSRELRPRKMQKRGQLLESWLGRNEAAAAAAVAASRRRSQCTLASPVKSPRSPISGGRNRARLIGAAAKILEPGLRPRARPPPPSIARLEFHADDALPEESGPASNNNCSFARRVPGGALEPRSSCEGKRESDCENFTLSDLGNSRSSRDGPGDDHKKKTPVIARGLNRASSSSSSPSPLPVQCSGNERGSSPILSNRNRTTSPVARAGIDVTKDKSNVNSALKQNNMKQNQLPLAAGEVARRGSTVHGRQNNIRDGIALHEARGLSSAKKNLNISKAPIIKAKRVDRMDVARKGQSSNNLRSGNTSIGKPKLGTQRNAEKDLINGKETEQVRTKPVGRNPARSGSSDSWKEAELGNVNVVGSPASSIVSFTFSSPMKHVAGSLNSSDITEKRGEMKESLRYAVFSTELMDSDAYYQSSSHKETTFRQDISRNLVEQKTRGVDSLDRGDLEKKCDSSVIDRLNQDQKNTSDWTDSLMMGIKNKFQDAAKESTSTALPARDIDHLIGASFMGDDNNGFSGCSNGTTVSESNFWQNESKQELDFKGTSWSRNELKNNPGSASSITRTHGIFPFEVAIQERQVRFSAEAISNAELLLENIYSFGSDRPKDSFVELFFREKMGSILGAFYTSSRSGFNFTEPKAGNQLRNLVLECVIECLASMHDCFYNSGYKSWLKLIGFVTKDRLVSDIKKEIRGWNNMAGLDRLIGEDLDHSNEIRMDFSIESFQVGMRIGDDILQLLIDEIAMDVY
ncbi:hypothetical protein ACMD2_09065 [Ananas comosus]|uniref:DUF4378 domain-containing protein n=1 Tax=Ananas comosus TaxID=4615 RepID=A0A199VTG7_ANACO|nr:hypothetical protein ACMD2_09065 [Ananas comosus]